MSEVAWIVGSLKERDSALELLESESEAEPRDELNFGPLRDSLAEAFFPGITTLQTRAKYFLFVPQMYRIIENGQSKAPAETQIRHAENSLLQTLRASADTDGVIGSQKWVVPQTPSSAIYWTGLRTWRIRMFSDARPRYHRWLDGGRRLRSLSLAEEDGAGRPLLWHEFVGSCDVLENPQMSLTRDEAEFLRNRILGIRDRGSRSLLKDMVSDHVPQRGLPFWELEMVREGAAALSLHARDAGMLSTALHGAMLAYNYWCARLTGQEIWIQQWRDRCKQWSVDHPPSVWSAWKLQALWDRVELLPGGAEARRATKPFVDAWVAELRRNASTIAAERESARRLIEIRERQAKRTRARLAGGPALRSWDGATGIGAAPMRFRWPQAARVLRDIETAPGR